MKRKIIKIDEELCDGCGDCVSGCSEGALQIVNGKAKLVKEKYCDGFGDCIGECPTGALTIEERDAENFDIAATKEYLLNSQGEEAVKKFENAQVKHSFNEEKPDIFQGCPGTRMREIEKVSKPQPVVSSAPAQVMQSDLQQWPVQLHLVPPQAPFFKDRELVVMNTCGPIASADVHWRYLRGRGVVVACPKLDDTRNYAYKLGEIFKEKTIPKVIVVRIEVPCCRGLTMIAQEAVELSGRTDLVLEEQVLTVDGSVKEVITV